MTIKNKEKDKKEKKWKADGHNLEM